MIPFLSAGNWTKSQLELVPSEREGLEGGKLCWDMIWLLECGVLALRLKEWVKVRLKFMEGL